MQGYSWHNIILFRKNSHTKLGEFLGASNSALTNIYIFLRIGSILQTLPLSDTQTHWQTQTYT